MDGFKSKFALQKRNKQKYLTNFCHLRHRCDEGSVCELGGIVINILNFNNELRLGLQGFVGIAVDGLGVENVMGFLLPVQTLGGVDVSRYLVDDEDSTRPFPAQDVSDGAVAFV